MVHTTKFSVAAEKLLQKANKPDTPPAIREQLIREAREMPDRNVFGAGHKKDKNGKLIEMGVGSAGNQTQQSIEAYIWTQPFSKRMVQSQDTSKTWRG